MMIGNLQVAANEPANSLTKKQTEDLIQSLGASLKLIDDELRTHFPDRYPDLQETLGLTGGEKLRRWAEHPGEPQFTPAEAQDFLRNS